MKNTPRSRLVLIELVVSLVVFALCAVVCVSLLVYARSMSRESTELTQAVYLAQSAAETFRSATMEEAASQMGGTITGQDLTVRYSRDWKPDPNGPYTLTLTSGSEPGKALRVADISVSEGSRSIYVLTAAAFHPGPAVQGTSAVGEVTLP